MLRRGDVLVVRWIDRLGRNYADVIDIVREFMRRGVIIRTVINGPAFDRATTDPMQQAVRDALIAFMAASAQAQAEATEEAQRAGIEHAKDRATAYRGRKPSFNRSQLATVRDMLSQGSVPAAISKATGASHVRYLPHRGRSGCGGGHIGKLGDVSFTRPHALRLFEKLASGPQQARIYLHAEPDRGQDQETVAGHLISRENRW